MNIIKLSTLLAIISITIITIIFLAIISPLHGLKLLTFPLILIGIVLWIVSLILLIAGLGTRKREPNQRNGIIRALLFVIGFIPIGLLFILLSGNVRTKITVIVVNQSDSIVSNVLIYGTGDIFEKPDTLRKGSFMKGDILEYVIRPNTEPFRKGFIRMEFDINNNHLSKNIAGEFSINPYNIQQNWEILIDNEFVK